jgi:ribosomal protein S18 acetylase RimI-like enzyme
MDTDKEAARLNLIRVHLRSSVVNSLLILVQGAEIGWTGMAATAVERLRAFRGNDLSDLCDAAEEGIKSGGGFGWLTPPRLVMESFWRGVLLIPDRMLFVGRLDGVIAGTAQLVRPAKNNEAQARSAAMTTHFVAPWARGHGLARGIVLAVEEAARTAGALVLNLDVRETQAAAIQLYQSLGYRRWGTHPRYAQVGGQWIAGLYLCKDLAQSEETQLN